MDIGFVGADGSAHGLSEHEGQVLLIVNVASLCGFTPQYDGLDALQERFADRGFSVLGFPANDFGSQEPGSDGEIQEFCRTKFGLSFPVFAKIAVTGPDQHPLYGWLTREQPVATVKPGSNLREELRDYAPPPPAGGVLWNFEKFLVDRSGKPVGRFESDIEPDDPVLIAAIERALG
ncbi:MAG: glutathione peroxidase [Cereibacter sphaeroides]|uniref:Glutathione peroxidase n=1 Tax=Cereibacter sphaeroides TaxID=1063 RepID=A0A2W5S975_CERSP|nr:MAG: glutathione peroxidase [Cereibacter sphaeroides]